MLTTFTDRESEGYIIIIIIIIIIIFIIIMCTCIPQDDTMETWWAKNQSTI